MMYAVYFLVGFVIAGLSYRAFDRTEEWLSVAPMLVLFWPLLVVPLLLAALAHEIALWFRGIR